MVVIHAVACVTGVQRGVGGEIERHEFNSRLTVKVNSAYSAPQCALGDEGQYSVLHEQI